MKTTIVFSIAALMALTACGGSGNSDHTNSNHKEDTGNNTAKYMGQIEGNNGSLKSDSLYIIKTADGKVNINVENPKMPMDSHIDNVKSAGIVNQDGSYSGIYYSDGKLHYATFGILADYHIGDHSFTGHRSFFLGAPTQGMPNSDKVNYEGQVVQADEEGKGYAKGGTMMATADFSNKSINIDLKDVKHPASIQAASIVGNTFSGEEDGVKWSGGFFGAGAAEMAGIAHNDDWNAAYGGTKK